jgi:hypothetical protein
LIALTGKPINGAGLFQNGHFERKLKSTRYMLFVTFITKTSNMSVHKENIPAKGMITVFLIFLHAIILKDFINTANGFLFPAVSISLLILAVFTTGMHKPTKEHKSSRR